MDIVRTATGLLTSLVGGVGRLIAPAQSLKALDRDGTRAKATVIDVRDDRDLRRTSVTYQLLDRSTRAPFTRTGVLQRHLPHPMVGQKIDVVYMPSDPDFSRLLREDGCEFS